MPKSIKRHNPKRLHKQKILMVLLRFLPLVKLHNNNRHKFDTELCYGFDAIITLD